MEDNWPKCEALTAYAQGPSCVCADPELTKEGKSTDAIDADKIGIKESAALGNRGASFTTIFNFVVCLFHDIRNNG
jgi:hypothetical protein